MTDSRPAAALHRRAYRFFGRLVVVHSDTLTVADVLDAVYERQRVAEPPPGEAAVLVQVLSTTPMGAVIGVGDRRVRVPDPTQLAHYAHLVLVNAAAAAADDRLVLHAGAVARDGRAAVVVGASGWGKTTLTMELVRRGWRLLTDDFAPITVDGLVEPFVRRVNLTERSVALLGLPDPSLTPGAGSATPRLVGFDRAPKWMVDIDSVFPDRVADPARLAAVYLLGPQREPGAKPVPGRWLLRLDHLPPGFLGALGTIPGVLAVARTELDGPPTVAVDVTPGARVVAPLDAACARFDVAVLWAGRGDAYRPSFAGEPAAAPLPISESVPELLAHALSLSGRRFIAGTSPADAFLAMAHLQQALAVSGASVYRLTPGRLAATADLVEART
jgi:hypothetical protein